ncbi:MAG TPA: hypothetical protein VFZ36_13980 [Vicinamibacterales bacterium]
MRVWAAVVLAAVQVVYHDRPPGIDPELESALAAAEAAVEEYIRADPPRAERILREIVNLTNRHVHCLPVPAAEALPRTTGWVMRLGGRGLKTCVVSPVARLVADGFAAFLVGDTLFFSADLEERLPPDRLAVVVAHELSHDRLDGVRKHLHRSVTGTTAGQEAWLASRLEDRAHLGAMEKLAAAGMNPRLVIEYVRRQNPDRFSREHVAASIATLEAALSRLPPHYNRVK